MDASSDDGDCQVEAVITPTSKKSKQARLPFQSLGSDLPSVNKKRKSAASPTCRNAKVPKVNKKQNSVESSKKTDIEEEVTVDDENVAKNTEKIVEKNDSKDDLKSSTEVTDSKIKKTPGRTPKTKKLEPRIQLTPLTKFLKKVDNKDKISKDGTQADAQKCEESKSKDFVNNSQDKVEKSQEQNGDQENEEKNSTQKSNENLQKDKSDLKHQSEDETSDVVDIKNLSLSDDGSSNADISNLNEVEKMDEDSDVNIIDDSMSDTDSKKTEHEDTDSRDDCIKNTDPLTTPVRIKILDPSKTKKLTPKQAAKKLESQKKREMREKQRLEREKKLQEERESRKREKEEKKREQEEKKREREEMEKALKEQKRKEKEQKELKKQAELEQKQKEKEAKEEDRRKKEAAKEEEKRKKEEEKLEAERKKQKAASTFVSFFVPKKTVETKPVEKEIKVEIKNFMPFEVKADMRIAPVLRRSFTNEEKLHLDKLVSESSSKKSDLYIDEIKNKKFTIRKSERTWPFEANDDVVVLEDEDNESSNVVQPANDTVKKHRAKLFLFNENRRPPYWGTWRKESATINPRRPFALDKKWFDYEIDSDDEWEEEEPGESLRGSDDEKEEDPDDNEYDVDNDFMVPHGYLSEEEIMADEEEGEEDDDENPEKQKTKLKILNEKFEAERKQKTTKLHPKVIGCVWLNKDNSYPENTPSHTVRFLTARQAWTRELPLTLTAPADGEFNSECPTPQNKNVMMSALKERTLEDAMPDLIRLLHGNTNGRSFLVKEFLEFWSKRKEDTRPLPKIRMKQRIGEVAKWGPCPEPGPMHEKMCWYVTEENRAKYLPEETLSLPNRWTYSLTPKKRNVAFAEAIEKVAEEKEREKEKKTMPLITQFTKTLTAEEMQKQLAEKAATSKLAEKPSSSVPVTKVTPQGVKPLKRVALISLPRCEFLVSKSPRVSLIDKFVSKESSDAEKNKKEEKPGEVQDDDECMIVDTSDEIDVTTISTESESDKNKSVC